MQRCGEDAFGNGKKWQERVINFATGGVDSSWFSPEPRYKQGWVGKKKSEDRCRLCCFCELQNYMDKNSQVLQLVFVPPKHCHSCKDG